MVVGISLFGKVDVIPGICHVATKFGHFNYFPVLPLGSCIVLSEYGDRWRGVPTELSIKSVCIAWIRAILWVFVGYYLLGTLANLVGGNGKEMMIYGALSLSLLSLIKGSYFLTSIGIATFERAREIAIQAGFSEEVIAQIEDYYHINDQPDYSVEDWDGSEVPRYHDQ